MLDSPQGPTPEAEEAEGLGSNPGLARRLANLRPAWTSESAPRRGGIAKDGGGTKDHPIRATLRKQLAKRRELHRFVNAWIEAAIKGDSQAREQILKRLDPVLEEQARGAVEVKMGIRLELPEGERVEVAAMLKRGGEERVDRARVRAREVFILPSCR